MLRHIAAVFIGITLLCSASIAVTAVQADTFYPWQFDKLVGSEAPVFTARDLSGKEVSLSSFKGKAVLLNFWATWCPYCRQERKLLNNLYSEYREKGLEIVAVSTDRSVSKVKSYLEKIPSEFVILHDDGKKAARAYNIYSLPTSYLIDRNGILRHKLLGLKDWTDSSSKKLIDNLLSD